MKIHRVCVVGLGYIGLPTAAVLATSGFEVVGVDNNPEVVEALQRGELHIQEPGLRTLVEAARSSGRLSIARALEHADAFIVCVPTPLTPERTADLSCVISASEAIVPCLQAGDLVIIESTIPPGTTQEVVAPILERSGLVVGSGGDGLLLVHCPERVIPGQIVREIISNDRLIGGTSRMAAERACELYGRFAEGQLLITDAATAEFVKLVENTFRDVNIALVNELARVSEMLGLDVREVIELANHHPRVRLHQPGPGVGGHCLPIDPWFIVEKAAGQAELIGTARRVNDGQPEYVAWLVRRMLAGVDQPRVVLLGAAYKEDVDDTRESPTARTAPLLEAEGIEVRVVDPHTQREEWSKERLLNASKGADLVVLMCAHAEFLALDADSIGSVMRSRNLLDTRAALNLELWRSAGFTCHVLGNGRDGCP